MQLLRQFTVAYPKNQSVSNAFLPVWNVCQFGKLKQLPDVYLYVFIRQLRARVEERLLMQYVHSGYKMFVELGKYLLQRGVIVHSGEGRVDLLGLWPQSV